MTSGFPEALLPLQGKQWMHTFSPVNHPPPNFRLCLVPILVLNYTHFHLRWKSTLAKSASLMLQGRDGGIFNLSHDCFLGFLSKVLTDVSTFKCRTYEWVSYCRELLCWWSQKQGNLDSWHWCFISWQPSIWEGLLLLILRFTLRKDIALCSLLLHTH